VSRNIETTAPAGALGDPRALRAVFDSAAPYAVGIEDEVMLLDPDTLELVPRASQLLERIADDPRFKLELPASQLEILTRPTTDIARAENALRDARATAAAAADGLVRLAGAGVHPFSPGSGQLNRTPPYEQTVREYGAVAARQLVCALQVHVAAGDSDRALAVYNELRSYLPLLAALAANAPFYEGRDTGFASVRPKLAELLPRQGVPPAIESWEQYAEILRWGARSGAFPDARTWWWELRLHPMFGTLELCVPDSQSSVSDAGAIAGVAQALVAWLGERHDGGEPLEVAASWQIEENRWAACRYGVDGTMADLRSGERRSTRACWHDLLELLRPTAQQLGAITALERAEKLIDRNGAIAQRDAARHGGARAAARWLTDRFLD
jgi:carboxylate-amine ligase